MYKKGELVVKNQEQKTNYEAKALPDIFRELEQARYSQTTIKTNRKESK